MPKKRNIKRKSSNLKKVGSASLTAGKWLLEFLGVMLELMPTIETPYAHVRRLEGWPREIPKYRIHEEVKRMKDRGWIQEAEKHGRRFIKLTAKGRLELLYRKLQLLDQSQKRKWDGTWWIAMFDIPERGRKERDAIRNTLILAGFYRLQKSVYIYPYKIPKELVEYLRTSKLLPYIRFVHVDHLDDTRAIKKFFKLSHKVSQRHV